MIARASHAAAAFSATFCAGVMLGHQVAGKAARDALFLSVYSISDLPKVVIAASIVSMAVAFASAAAMRKLSPHRLVPISFLASAALLLGQWAIAGPAPRIVAVTLYLHTVVFGAVLTSGFWSMINERFDPRAAKRLIGTIASGGTIGGLFGALAAERVGANLSVAAILPILAGSHVLCAYLVRDFVGTVSAGVAPPVRSGSMTSGSAEIQRSDKGYLGTIAVLVAAVTVCAALLDYVFKATASATFTSGESLMRFFAAFHAAVGLASFVVQSVLTRRFLEKLGLAAAVAALPGAALVACGAILAVPGLAAVIAGRGAEAIVRFSLYRSGYELLYLPLRPERKRATKTVIDVGVDRLGEALGGGLIALVLTYVAASANALLVTIALALAAIALGAALILRRGYVKMLEESLLGRASEIEPDVPGGGTMESSMMRISFDPAPDPIADQHRSLEASTPWDIPRASFLAAERIGDEVVERISALRSGEPARVRPAIADAAALDPVILAHLIPLLAMDEVRDDAERVLLARIDRAGGQLIDVLLDPEEDFVLRRRIPRVLGAWKSGRSIAGLLQGLEDKRFEVRFQCGGALARIAQENPSLVIEEACVFAAIRRAVAVDKAVWESHRLLDLATDDENAFADELLRERASRSMQHVFTLLSLVLTREPLQVAFRGLYTDDLGLRGIALEYLETVLPADIKEGLWPFLEESTGEAKRRENPRARDRVVEELMRSRQSIQLNLEATRRR